MSKFREHIDLVLIFVILGLVSLGVIGIYSATFSVDNMDIIYKQIASFFIGTITIIIIQFIHPRLYFSFAYYILALLILLLIIVKFAGSVQMGARRWINLGGFYFQPSEIGKLFYLIAVSRFFAENKINKGSIKTLIKACLLFSIPVILVMSQPDLGTSLVYAVVFISIIFAAGIPIRYIINFLLILSMAVIKVISLQFFVSFYILFLVYLYKTERERINSFILAIIALISGFSGNFLWHGLKDYQKMRILTFINPEQYSRNGGWQLIQSKIAIMNGGFCGNGFLNGPQTQLKFLPEGHTDFIFSVLAEEFGFIGVLFIFLLFSIFLYRIKKILIKIQNKFYYYIGVGILSIFIYQIIINVGMTIGLTPVTGLPLPFLSYGGSALLFNMVMLGVFFKISSSRRDF